MSRHNPLRRIPSRHSAFRPAFTIIEILVVIAVIGILLALLMTAIQPIREASNRTTCQNNLRQMALACLQHHDLHEMYPSGGCHWTHHERSWKDPAKTAPAVWNSQTWGWAYQILPYIDQTALWQIPKTTSDGKDGDTLIGSNPIKIFNCPSARGFIKFWYAQTGPGQFRYMWDYSGNGGTWGNWTNNDRELAYLKSQGGGFNAYDGPLVASRSVSKRSASRDTLLDGPSNVLLIGEKYLDKGTLTTTSVCNDDQGWIDGWDNDTIAFARGGSPTGTPILPQRFQSTGGSCGLFYGSAHSLMQCAFSDGSVHSLRFNIDPKVWVALCSGNDGATFQSSAYQ
jgi:prepilin-type N-terminal cleavage/methylation domain-containing protein